MRFGPSRRTATIGLAGLLGACSTMGTPDSRGQDVAAAGAPVGALVAVYQSLFVSNASALQERAAAYCIGTGSGADVTDPGQDVLIALRDNPKVKPASACEAGPMGSRIVDRQSRQPALLFSVETASCASAGDCTIYGGYYEGNVSSQRNLYRARRADGRWNVTVKTPGPIS